MVLGGDFMAETRKISIALAESTMEKLDRYCADKGIKRPSAISIAIDKLWKEEYADEK